MALDLPSACWVCASCRGAKKSRADGSAQSYFLAGIARRVVQNSILFCAGVGTEEDGRAQEHMALQFGVADVLTWQHPINSRSSAQEASIDRVG